MQAAGVRTGAALVTAAALLVLAPAASAQRSIGSYVQTNLVADQSGKAQLVDSHLQNPWGLAFGPATPAWVANNGKDNSTLYAGGVSGSPVTQPPLIVSVPGAPTGQVFNGTDNFMVGSGPATFIFSTEKGQIFGWNTGTAAEMAASVRGASFKGLAILGDKLYATDFKNARVDVLDSSFKQVRKRGAFVDSRLPKRFAPFGIEAVGNRVIVTYAKQNKAGDDDAPGAGLGFVDVYNGAGRLEKRLIKRGPLNAPWGVAMAPSSFGAARGDLLIGNFGGPGRIDAFNPRTGSFRGALRGTDGKPLAIEGLWALKFGTATIGGPGSLLFTAGTDHERHGLFGSITPDPNPY
jgi:uncharacterized protein (TIGR03118 family)